MGKVTALMMDVITEKSGHTIVPNAVSVCLTPCAPSPVPIPYPVVGNAVEGITDPPMRTKVEGQKFATTGSVIKTCHGNEPGTLKETCSLNTAGPCFIIMGAPIVIAELGMMGITGALCISNKAITVGAGGSASGAGGAGGPGGGGGGAGAGGAGPSGPSGPSNGGGGGGGSNSGASASAASPGARGSGADAAPGTSSGPPGQHQCQNGHPVDMATGHVVDEAVDLEIAGLIPFVFKRYYSSARRNDVRATLGPGWAHNWEMALWEEGNVTVLRDAEGRSIFFEQIPVGGSTFHRGERMELKRITADRWEIFHVATRRTYQFEAFEAGGQAALRHVRDAWDNRIELGYEGGRLFVIVDTAGREIRVLWQGQRMTRLDVRVGGSSEQTVDFLHNDAGCLAAVTDALGNTETFEYDAQRRMVATTLKTNVTFRYEYEEDSGRCSRTWGPKGLYDLTFSADLANQKTFADGEEPRVYTVDDHGHVTREALPNGVIFEERAYDEDGYLIAEVNGAGEGAKYWYDRRGNLVRRVDAEGAVTAWEYDERDQAVSKTTPDGLTIRTARDHRGALSRVSYPTGASYALTHDARGRIVRIDDVSGSVIAYTYDGHDNVATETDAKGAVTKFGYDALGRSNIRVDAMGGVTRLQRDRLGRVVAITVPDGGRITRKLDAVGRIVEEVNPAGEATKQTYSGMGALSTFETPDGRKWSFRYNAKERLTAVTSPRGEKYGFVYDEAGRIVEEHTFDGRRIAFQRDLGGRPVSIVYSDGATRSFEYDREGRMLDDVGSDGTAIRYKRDKFGRVVEATAVAPGAAHVTQFEWDALGRVVLEQQDGIAIRYGHDASGRLTERVLPNGSKTEYTYDRVGDLVSVSHNGRKFLIEHDAVGAEVRLSPASGGFSLSFGYDLCGRVTSQRVRTAGATGGERATVARHLAYDRAGRLSSVTDERWGVASFRYHDGGELAGVRQLVGDTKRELEFAYDPVGSLVEVLEGEGGGRRKAHEPRRKVGQGGVVTELDGTRHVYDKNGRRAGSRDLKNPDDSALVTYRWDVRDRLREVRLPDGRRFEYRYDAFGRRVAKLAFEAAGARPTRTTRFLWSGNVVIAELAEDEAPRVFVHRPGTFYPVLQEERGEVFLYVNDHLGTPRELIDSQGGVAWSRQTSAWGEAEHAVVDPARAASGTAPSSPFRLMGQFFDEDVQLSWTRFRVFDAKSAQWLSADPLGLSGGSNLFGFDGAPTVVADPLGLATGVPTHAQQTLDHIDANGTAPPGHVGGRQFMNDGRGGGQVLPRTDSAGNAVTYQEWDVHPHTPGVNRGRERVVTGSDGSAYYTDDHYSTFTQVR